MSDRIPTLADVCCAIAEGHLSAVLDGPVYQVSARELRRYFKTLHPLPAISSTRAKLSPRPDFLDWSADIKNSTAWSLRPFFSGSEQSGCARGR